MPQRVLRMCHGVRKFCLMLIVSGMLSACAYDIPFMPSRSQGFYQFASHSDPSLSTRQSLNEKLRHLSEIINQMQMVGLDTTVHQQQFVSYQNDLIDAKTPEALQQLALKLDGEIAALQLTLAQGNAKYLVRQFHQSVDEWGKSHQYQDPYDGKSYPLDYEYNQEQGFGSQVDQDLQNAKTLADYQKVGKIAYDLFVHLKTMQDDTNDEMNWDALHATDMRLIQYYQVHNLVIVVSLYDQAMRIYQNGTLIKAYQVVTGQFLRPTPPGLFHLSDRFAEVLFTSYEPVGSPLYYPPMIVHDAVAFRDQGYFIHASPWRTYYGRGKNFPHDDPQNGNVEARDGSHGCVNLPLDQAHWVYENAPNGTAMIIY